MKQENVTVQSKSKPLKNSNGIYSVLEGDNREWFPILDKFYKDKNKVQLIYLDPPYNTGRTRGARKHFSDTNSKWSDIMRHVLQKSYDYLKSSGFLAVSLNQMEMFNLKNIADKRLGRTCYNSSELVVIVDYDLSSSVLGECNFR